jgi:hypothetical protein
MQGVLVYICHNDIEAFAHTLLLQRFSNTAGRPRDNSHFSAKILVNASSFCTANQGSGDETGDSGANGRGYASEAWPVPRDGASNADTTLLRKAMRSCDLKKYPRLDPRSDGGGLEGVLVLLQRPRLRPGGLSSSTKTNCLAA